MAQEIPTRSGTVATTSCPQPLEVLLDLRRQLRRLFVEVGQLGVDVAQRLLEVEVLVLLWRGDADVAAGGKAPVGGLDLRAVHDLHQPRHGFELGLRETVLEPYRLPVEVDGVLQLFDGVLTPFVEAFD